MMRRYRKGQTFRPPTAAESAAQADAIEAFRRSPGRPQDRKPVGQHILVKTPEGGIQARDGETIYWEWCKRCIQRNAGSEKEIVETDEQLIVFNTLEQAVAGDVYVMTGLTECGVRHVLLADVGGTTTIRFRILSAGPLYENPNMVCGIARVEVLDVSCNATGVSIGDEVYVFDPDECWLNIPIEVLVGATGKATKMSGGAGASVGSCIDEYSYEADIGDCWFLVDSLCCTGEIYYE